MFHLPQVIYDTNTFESLFSWIVEMETSYLIFLFYQS